MKLIDADALELHGQLEPMGNGQYEYIEVVYKDDIDDAPTIDVEPKTGKWVWSDEDASWTCGCCDCVFEEIDWKPNYNFCPNCGARMNGGEEE